MVDSKNVRKVKSSKREVKQYKAKEYGVTRKQFHALIKKSAQPKKTKS